MAVLVPLLYVAVRLTLCSSKAMSRGGRGARGGGRGGFRGGAAFGANPPMGLTFADIQAISREADALYPVGWRSCLLLRDDPLISISAQPLDPLPVLSDFSAEEKKISELQTGFITRLRQSPYYVVETVKSNGQVVPTSAHTMLIYVCRA